MTSTRKLVKAAIPSSAPARPSRRASALSSILARSSSHLNRRVTSLTASETRSPTDWPPPSSRGLVAAGSVIDFSPPRAGCPVWRAVPVGCTLIRAACPGHRTGRVWLHPAQGHYGAVLSRLRQKILRDGWLAAGHHTIRFSPPRKWQQAHTANGAPSGGAVA